MMDDGYMVVPRPQGRSMAESWWGKAWNRNLEGYSDYSNRLPRGRSYLRNGAVSGIRITEGRVDAKVQGSRARPYDVRIDIRAADPVKTSRIVSMCTGKVRNVEELADGRFPEEVGRLFLSQDGLFPRPSEISFRCSCPDWADMCKHVAAVMYGIGRVFDRDPMLFFNLRGIDTNDFIGKTAQAKMEEMMRNADRPSSRILSEERMMELFGFGTDSEEVAVPVACDRIAEEAEVPSDHVPGDDGADPSAGEDVPEGCADDGIMWKIESAVRGCIASTDDPDDLEPRMRAFLSDICGNAFTGSVASDSEFLRKAACLTDSIVMSESKGGHRELDYLIAWMLRCASDRIPGRAFVQPGERNY